MSLNIIDQLKLDHELALSALNVMAGFCFHLERDEAVDLQKMTDLIDFFSAYIDGIHHLKEELFLFPFIEDCGFPKDSGPLSVLLSEHEKGREFLKFMRVILQAPLENDEQKRRLIFFARNYIGLLTDHIMKENNVLFPIAENILNSEQIKKIDFELEKANLNMSYTDKLIDSQRFIRQLGHSI